MFDNILSETKDALADHGKSLNDIQWFGYRNAFVEGISIQEFLSSIKALKEDTSNTNNLILVGEGFWLQRNVLGLYGWWDYYEVPTKPITGFIATSPLILHRYSQITQEVLRIPPLELQRRRNTLPSLSAQFE